MKLTRDSVILTVGWVGSLVILIASVVAENLDVLADMVTPQEMKWTRVVVGIIGAVSGKLSTSNLSISPQGYAKEVQEHRVAVVEKQAEARAAAATAPIPPVSVSVPPVDHP